MVQSGITAICCTTAARRWCLPLAIRNWDRQTYTGRKELIIVFSGPGTIWDIVPSQRPDIRIIRADDDASLGAKHNLGATHGIHPWLCKWDDDDWYAPRRLAESMRIAQMHDAELVGTTAVLFYELIGEGRTWIYEHGDVSVWVAGNTMLFTRELWKRVPFPDRQSGVDTVFVWNALHPDKGCAKSVSFSDPGLCVLMVHGQTTGRKRWNPKPPEYRRWPADIRTIMGTDLALYEEAFVSR